MSEGNGAGVQPLPPPMLPPPPGGVLGVAVQILQTIGTEVQSGIAELRKLGGQPPAPITPMVTQPAAAAAIQPTNLDDLTQVLYGLEKRLSTDASLRAQLASNIRAVLSTAGVGSPSAQDVEASISRSGFVAAAVPTDRISVQAFWWGFHFVIPEKVMNQWETGGTSVASFIAALAPVTGPAAPFVALAAAYVAAEFGLMKAVDRGRGVYLSMLWIVPGVFVPTSI